MCGLAFLAMASYALARPPAESLFLEHYTKDGLPLVWLAVAVTVVVVVAIYNRFAGAVPLARLMAIVSALSGVTALVLLLAHATGVPHAAFLLYVWKDVYIVVMVEVFWTFANCTTTIHRARWIYGLFLAAGGLGGIAGNLLVGELATRIGTVAAMVGSALDLFLVAALTWLIGPLFPDVTRGARTDTLRGGIETFRRSKMLPLLLAVVVISQLAITLVDYDFNASVAETYPDRDLRTQAIGRVYARIDALQIVLQLGAGGLFRVLGVEGVLVLVPLVLGGAVTAFALAPGFELVAWAKVISKAFDYSLFRASKEILYIPLALDEKTRGKAIVDIFGYRVAKGMVSLGLLAIGSLALGVASGWTVGLVIVWIALLVPIVRRYRAGAAEA